jgi:hypothetical protein
MAGWPPPVQMYVESKDEVHGYEEKQIHEGEAIPWSLSLGSTYICTGSSHMWQVPVQEKSLLGTLLLGDWDPMNSNVRGSRVLGTRTCFSKTVQATCEPWVQGTHQASLLLCLPSPRSPLSIWKRDEEKYQTTRCEF